MRFVITLVLLCFAGQILCGEYYYSNGTKYYISAPMKKNWYQSQRYCHGNSMHLVTVHTEEENKMLLDIIYGKFKPTKPDDHFWTSGTDMGNSDLEFYWVESGQATLFTNWMIDHPVKDRKGCILLHSGIYNYKWYDEVCEYSYYFICQDRLFIPNSSMRNMLLNSSYFED